MGEASVRVAAVGDVHASADSGVAVRAMLARLAQSADLLLLAGDLTRVGTESETAAVATSVEDLEVPVLGVLGNHDHHAGRPEAVRAGLEGAGVRVLEGETAEVQVGDLRIGVAGVKGFGGGFSPTSGNVFGEAEMKAFVSHSRDAADALHRALSRLRADLRIALLHYSPIRDTLEGEPLEIYPFLGSSLLAEAVDSAGADLVVHGHAHHGRERGMTPGGVPVRNVGSDSVRATGAVYRLRAGGFVKRDV